MTALISALIFVAIVVLVAVVVIWAIETLLAALGGPPNVALICRVVVILIALLVIVNRLLPLAGSFT
jgi:hypothetical protein